MGCLQGIAKYLLFFFNFIIVLCGAALIAVGAILLVNEDKGLASFTNFSVGGVSVALGVIVFLIAFFGCCGAIQENSCLLTIYGVILIVVLIAQIVFGAFALVETRNDDGALDDAVERAVREVFDSYVKDQSNADKREIVDNIQQGFECCGVEGPTYWHYRPPSSCCPDDYCSEHGFYQKGCAEKFQEVVTDNIEVIGGVAIGLAVLELVGAIFAFCVR